MSSSTGMIGIDLKKGDRVDITRPLVRFIRGAFPEKVEDIMVGIEDLSKMRDSSLTPEKSEKGVDSLLRYYLQLTSMDSKLPINENQIHITFTWYDAFYKDSVFSGKRGSQSNSLFERSAILFNMGALSSQIAAAQNLDTDDGLKIAAKYFQVASGAFSHLRDKMVPMLQKIPTPDLSIEVLSSLTLLMQAQAQECIYHKAVADKMKEKVTCRLAASGMDLYSEAYKAMSNVNMKGSSWDKWTATCLAKQNYLGGLAEYYQSVNAKASNAIGEELSRLKEADKCLTDAVKQSSGNFECKDVQSKINRALAAAEKDNNFIYHERVPNIKDLPAIGRAPVAKPTPLPSQIEGWSDVFAALVPLNVQQAATMYASRKDHLIHVELTKLRDATQSLNSALNQMNLPAALEDLSGKEMPASLLEKGSDVRTKGGIMQLRKLFEELPQLLQRNEEILRDTMKSIDDEENNDKHLRSQFGEKWQRTKSEDINRNMREQGQKYQQILDNAKNADKIVREKFEKNFQAIDILSKDETELVNSIPAGGAQSLSQEGQKAVATLKSYLDQVKLLKGERDSLEEKFKAGGDTEEIISKFSQLNVENNLFNDEAISSEQLEKVYGPLQAAVQDSIKSQDDLIAKITTANDEFVRSKSGSTTDPRSETMTSLANGYDAFIELQSNLQEGNKFYNNLTKILTTFQSQVNDFVFARNTEKEDLMKTLQSNIAKAAPPARPAPPTFHQQAAPAATPAAATSAAVPPPSQSSSVGTPGLSSGPTPQAPPLAPPAAPQSYGAAYYSGVQGYNPTYGYPQTQYGGYYTYPGPQYPPGQYSYGQYPPTQYPPGQYPPAQYPPGQYPPGQHPPYTGPK